MGDSTAKEVWRLAAKQHGVVTRSQLLKAGLGGAAIQHRLGNGPLHRIHRGVYAVGRPQLDQLGRWLAAALACGSHAVLSHRSAAALWGILRRPSGPIEVSVPLNSSRGRPGSWFIVGAGLRRRT
jgi:predicted transcriptional regulator of viral defense system